jgi:drug/metabolite transporter (DMT)-like permease
MGTMGAFIIPLLAALARAVDLLESKFLLTRRKISLRDYNPITFLFLAGFSALLMPWLGHVDSDALLTPHGLGMVVGIIAVATAWNMLYYAAIRREKVNASESIIVLMPITTIILAWLFEPSRFDPSIALAAAVAMAALLWGFGGRSLVTEGTHVKLGLAIILMSIENLMVAQVLQQNILSPVALYTIRTLVIFIIFFLYYRPAVNRLKPTTLGEIIIGAAIGATTMLLWFYGLRDVGPVVTALVMTLSPILVFAASAKILHERLKFRQLVSAMVLIGAVAYAVIAAGLNPM